MIPEKFATAFIYIHASFGGLALICGLIGLLSRKGGFYHRKAGKLFYYSLLVSVAFSIIIALLPSHRNVFLFSIGVFSGYLIVGGYRAIAYKNLKTIPIWDRLLPILMLTLGCIMVTIAIFYYNIINYVLLIFGILGIALSIEDLFRMKSIKSLNNDWLKMHLGKMMGGYIASVTAFLVVNKILPGYIAWFLPTILGAGYITYWNVKLGKMSK